MKGRVSRPPVPGCQGSLTLRRTAEWASQILLADTEHLKVLGSADAGPLDEAQVTDGIERETHGASARM